MNWDSSKVQVTLNWLNAETVKIFSGIAKQHGATKIQRLAQERGALGQIKLVVTFASCPGWYDNNMKGGAYRTAIIATGLTNQLTEGRLP